MNFFIPTVAAASDKVQRAEQVASEQAGVFAGFLQSALLWGIALGVIIFSFWIGEIVKKVVVRRLTHNRSDVHREVVILMERVTYFTVLVLGGIIGLSIVDINIVSIIGFMGLGIGFALKDLLGNFIAGVVILTQKKFKLGDFIRVNGELGRITNIESRTTEVKSIDGTQLIVPNSYLMTEVVQNFTSNNFRRISIEVGVHYDTPLRDVIELSLKTMNNHPDVLPDPQTTVLAKEFGESAITLELRFWIDAQMSWKLIKSEIIQDIKVAYDKAGVVIPFPIRTLSLDGFDQKLMAAAGQKPFPKSFSQISPQGTPQETVS